MSVLNSIDNKATELQHMVDDMFIKAVFNILKPHVHEDLEFETFTITSAADKGENFNDSLIGFSVVLKNVSDNCTERLDVIVKFLHSNICKSNPVSLKSFLKEIEFYKSSVPEYLKIQKEFGIPAEKMLDVFPKFYGFSELPEEAEFRIIIVLENLKTAGYKTLNERRSLDQFHTKLALKELAKFHAIGVALKIKKPEVHKMLLNKVAIPVSKSEGVHKRDEHDFKFRNEIKNTILALDGYELYADSVYRTLEKIDRERWPPISEPFATFLHNDLWLNNIMFRHTSENCVTVKFVDYQTTLYHSPARDIGYFLFTSTLLDVSNDYDSFVELYHKTFTDSLVSFCCDSGLFTLKNLYDEMNMYAPNKLKHIIILLKLYLPKTYNINGTVSLPEPDKKPESFDRRLAFVLKGFISRGWI